MGLGIALYSDVDEVKTSSKKSWLMVCHADAMVIVRIWS